MATHRLVPAECVARVRRYPGRRGRGRIRGPAGGRVRSPGPACRSRCSRRATRSAAGCGATSRFSNGRITELGAELVGSIHTRWCELAIEYGIGLISRMDDNLYAGPAAGRATGAGQEAQPRRDRRPGGGQAEGSCCGWPALASGDHRPVAAVAATDAAAVRHLTVAQALLALGVMRGSRLWLGDAASAGEQQRRAARSAEPARSALPDQGRPDRNDRDATRSEG